MHRRTLVFYLKFYLLFSVCVMLCLLPIWNYVKSEYRQQEIKVAQQRLNDGVETISSNLYDIASVVASFSTDSTYRTISSQTMPVPLSSTVTLSKLQNYFSFLFRMYPNVMDYGIICDNGLFLTRRRCFQGDSPYSDYLRYADMTDEEWAYMLYSTSNFDILPAQNIWSVDYGYYNALTFVCSPALSSRFRFYATLPVNDILKKLAPLELHESCSLKIVNAYGVTLLDQPLSEPSISIDCTSSAYGLTYTISIPQRSIDLRIRGFLITFFCYYAAISAIIFILAAIFSLLTHRPIRKIANSVQSLSCLKTEKTEDNYFTLIENTLSSLTSTVSDLENNLAEHIRALRNRYFENARSKSWLLKNKDTFLSYFPDFPSDYQLLIIEIVSDETNTPVVNSQIALINLLYRVFDPSVYCMTFENYVVLLLPLNEFSLMEEQNNKLLHVLRSCNINFICAISNPMYGILSLPDAYAQCMGILMQVNDNTDKIWSSSDFGDRLPAPTFNYEDMNNMYALVLKGDFGNVQDLIYSYYEPLHNSESISTYAYEEFFYSLRDVLLRIKIEHFDLLKAVEIPDYSCCTRLDSVLKSFIFCYDQVCSLMLQYNRTCQSELTHLIEQHIQKELSNPSLCIQSIASHFSISSSTLQKIIRNRHGTSCADYIEENRLSLAKELLTTTDQKVNDIVVACGYSSPNSFFKAFKRMTSMTPSEWRKYAQKDDSVS